MGRDIADQSRAKKTFPQRLKPLRFQTADGTAEAMPFQNRWPSGRERGRETS